jgi:putative addiction module killer protein
MPSKKCVANVTGNKVSFWIQHRMNEIITIKVTAGFERWLKALKNVQARAKILARIKSAGKGNFGDCKPVGDGVSEMRIHIRSGYRVYFMQHGLTIYILLIGGNKATQQQDIIRAKELTRQIKEGNYEHSDNPGF